MLNCTISHYASENESIDGENMTEATAYKWAAQAMRGLEGKVEPHLLQTLADRIVAAILAAAKGET